MSRMSNWMAAMAVLGLSEASRDPYTIRYTPRDQGGFRGPPKRLPPGPKVTGPKKGPKKGSKAARKAARRSKK